MSEITKSAKVDKSHTGDTPRVFIDIDGTLARFHDVDKHFIEAMWQEGFYRDLKPFENMVEGAALFIRSHPEVDVYILSAVLETDPPFAEKEKNEWLDRYLPEVDQDHRIFTKAGHDKSEYIRDLSRNDYLLDDYNRNLREFEAAGANAVKFRNDINHRGEGAYGGEKGSLWTGRMVNYDSSPEEICTQLETIMGLTRSRGENLSRRSDSKEPAPVSDRSDGQKPSTKHHRPLGERILEAQKKAASHSNSAQAPEKFTK